MAEQKTARKNLLLQPLNTELAFDASEERRSFRSNWYPALRNRLSVLARICVGLGLLMGLSLWGQDNFVLVTSPDKVQDVCGRHGLTQLTHGSPHGVFLVSTSSVDPSISTDSAVQSFERDRSLGVPELSGATVASLTQSSTSILDGLPGRTVVSYYGTQVASNYVTQPATAIIRQHDLQAASGFTGTGITVAVIDTGVDTSHPALQSALISGFNFISNVADPSELVDLTPGMAAALAQSSTSILDGPPGEFGHGTMTAGLVHLVAPGAQIMSLKAFAGDGSSDLFNIVRAIYYAADNGAQVISMSFEIAQGSPALQNAIQYALAKNVVLVAASGNDGGQILVFPSAYNSVIGVGSTSNSDARSSFTNFGTNSVFIAAPGEGVITTYPGGNYAAGWGTSFSTPIVAGEAALVLQARPTYKVGDVANAISRAVAVQQMGHGRVDLCLALSSIGVGSFCK